MKLALITPFPPYRGGISKHSENLYNELRKNNDVIVYSFSRLYPEILFPGTNQYLENSEYKDTDEVVKWLNLREARVLVDPEEVKRMDKIDEEFKRTLFD